MFSHLSATLSSKNTKELRKLLHGLEGDEAHVRPGHRFTNRLGIPTVVLIAFDVGLYELGAKQLYCVTQLLKLSRPLLRTATRLPPNETGRQLRHCLPELAPSHTLLNPDVAALVYAMELENTLGQINPQCCDVHF